MRIHEHDSEESVLRPKSPRMDPRPPAEMVHAAAAGRSDVLDAASILRLQRTVGNGGVAALLEEQRSPVHNVVKSGGGSPLAPDIRAEMSARLGHDFSDVRVHTDSQADDSARSVNAHAYTVGSDVVFQRGGYDPSSDNGKRMLAHELTHVVQQRSGPVDGTSSAGGIKISDPADRFEREAVANAEKAMSVPAPAAQLSASPPAVQRAEAPAEAGDENAEEEAAQGSFVQRQETADEEEETAEGAP
jgi:hypothetical protein